MKIEDLYPYVVPDLPGCPDETLRQAFVLTAIDFCQKTLVWNEIADAVQLVDGVSDYDIDYPSGAIAQTVTGVWCGEMELIPKSISELNDEIPNWRAATSNRPRYYNSPADWGSIRVYPIPSGIAEATPRPTITLRGTFLPKLSATELPNFMAERFLDCLTSGVKGRLMLQPRQTWTDAQLGAYHKGQYEELRTDARITVLADRVPGVTRVRPVRFGG